MMTTGKRVAKNLFSLFTGEAISSGLAFLITILLARRLGDEGFGRLAFVQAIMVYLMLLTDMGLSTFGSREIARQPEHAGRIMSRVFSLRLSFAAIIVVLFSIGLWFYPTGAEMKWLFFGSVLALLTMALNPEFIYQGTERMVGIAAWRIGVHLIYLALIFFLIQDRGDLAEVPFLRLLAEAGTLVFLAMIARRFLRQHLRWQLNRSIARNYLKESLIMAASVVVIKLYYTFDTFMLGIMDKPEAVGWYNAAYKIVLLLNAATALVQFAFAPQFAKYWNVPLQRMAIMQKFSALLCYLGCISAIPLIFLHKEIIFIIFGANYFRAENALFLLTISLFLVFLFSIFLSPLLYIGKQNKYLTFLFSATVVNALLNILLIPKYSLEGAAWAVIISNFILLIIVTIDYLLEYKEIKIFIGIVKLLTLAVIILCFSHLISVNNWYKAIIFIFSFTITTGYFQRDVLLKLAKSFFYKDK